VDAAAAFVRLTRRESDVLRLVRAGLSDRELAATLGISESTARSHLQALSVKLGVTRRMRIVARAESLGLV
jgi:DNA-binding NarL/FixJ family response regulator